MIVHRKRVGPERFAQIESEPVSVCIRSEESCFYSPGDCLVLREWVSEEVGHTGRELTRTVLAVSRGRYGIRPKYAAVAHSEAWSR